MSHLCNNSSWYSEQRAYGKDYEGQLPAFDKANDDASEKRGKRLNEHAKLIPDAFIYFVDITAEEKYNCVFISK